MNLFETLNRNKYTIISILVIIPAGIFTKFYHGLFDNWINNSLGGILYVIFWCLLFRLMNNRIKSGTIVMVIFILTCFIEFTQLFSNVFLDWIRSFFVGRIIIGTTFSISDFFHYLAGAILALFWLEKIRKLESG